jgi:hypothetical protein
MNSVPWSTVIERGTDALVSARSHASFTVSRDPVFDQNALKVLDRDVAQRHEIARLVGGLSVARQRPKHYGERCSARFGALFLTEREGETTPGRQLPRPRPKRPGPASGFSLQSLSRLRQFY